MPEYTEPEMMIDVVTHDARQQRIDALKQQIKDQIEDKAEYIHNGSRYDSIWLLYDGGYLDSFLYPKYKVICDTMFRDEKRYVLIIRRNKPENIKELYGINYAKGRWVAYARWNSHRYYVGSFSTQAIAKLAQETFEKEISKTGKPPERKPKEHEGVTKCGNKWRVDVFVNGKQKYLGLYSSIEEAKKAKDKFSVDTDKQKLKIK